MHRTVGVVGALVLLVLAIAVCPPAGATAAVASVAADPSAPAGAAVDALEDRLLTVRPEVGPVHVVSIAGEPAGRALTARSLQGIVNRSQARLYLLDGGDLSAAPLLQRYVDRGLVTVTATTGLDGALDAFAGELTGFVLADPAEPWSVHAAAVVASLEGGIVATADQVPALTARGLVPLDDTRGRWPDAVSAYLDLAAGRGAELPSRTVAVVRPTDTLWDFVVQQGILPLFTRPSAPSWGPLLPLLDAVPDGSPVYGYLSDTGEEEAIAVGTLAATGLSLIPTDTTRNLSFHLAVGADRPRVRAAEPDLDAVAPCTTDAVNVVVGMTDGDNLNVPLNHFLRPSNWGAANRGAIPIGWSISPSLAVLAPAAWDGYALEATPNDELVAMAGWAYGAPALLPDPADFYSTSFALMDELGLRTFWSLGGGLDLPGAAGWTALDATAGDGVPAGVLVGYGNGTGAAYHSPAGRPAFTSRSVYDETPADLAAHLDALLATPAPERPVVSFLSATNWTNPVDALISALAPYEALGVRFLTPAEATACMPDAPEPEPPAVAGPGECLPDGPVQPHGLELISAPTVAEIASVPLPFPVTAAVDATPTTTPGGSIDYHATVAIDLDAIGQTVLDERIRPIVEAGYGPELAATAWQRSRYDGLTVPFPAPAGTSPSGAPVVDGLDGAVAAWTGSGSDDRLEVTLPPTTADTRTPAGPIRLEVSWSVTVDDTDGASVSLVPGPVRFALDLEIGVLLGAFPLTGGATAAWACVADDGLLATTVVTTPDPDPDTDPDPDPTPPPAPAPAPAPTTVPSGPPSPDRSGPAVTPASTGPGIASPAAVPVRATPTLAG